MYSLFLSPFLCLFLFLSYSNFLCLYLHIFLSCSSLSFPARLSLDCDQFSVEQQPQTIFKLTSAAPEEVYLYSRHTCACVCVHTIKITHCGARMFARISFFQDIFFPPLGMRPKICYTNCSSCLLKSIIRSKRERERGSIISLSLSRLLGGHIGFSSASPICFSLHNLWRLIMFRQNDKRDTQTCGLAMISAGSPPHTHTFLPPPHSPVSSPCTLWRVRRGKVCFYFPCSPLPMLPFYFIFGAGWLLNAPLVFGNSLERNLHY